MAEKSVSRCLEIMDACETLFSTMDYKDITLKELSTVTSFSRSTIYNYFNKKEEIFLALLTREYKGWAQELDEIINSNNSLSKNAYTKLIVNTIVHRQQMLKIISLNLNDLEANTRCKRIVIFKEAYGETLARFSESLEKFFSNLNELERKAIIYSFFPFLYGVYAYTYLTKEQEQAMKDGGVLFDRQTTFNLIYKCLYRLLG